MFLSRSVQKAVACCGLALLVPGVLLGQGSYDTNGGEYAITGLIPGDQLRPQLALTPSGGYLVWQDNLTDGAGLGISAQRLDSSFSPSFAPFRVNASAAGDQERPQAALLSDGRAAFVWQGGRQGFQHIYGRFLAMDGTYVGNNDVQINTSTTTYQLNPAITVLANSNLVAIYSSVNQAASNSMQDVYGQVLSPSGQKLGAEFRVNQYTAFNQRTPSVAALTDGRFVVVWISEMQRSGDVDSFGFYSPDSQAYVYAATNRASVDVFARLFNADGSAAGAEFMVNNSWDICANPRVAAGTNDGFMVVWGQKSAAIPAYSWDIYSRSFTGVGIGGAIQPVNTYMVGDQYLPQISVLGTDYLVVWTSLGQDGSREGVYGQVLRSTGAPVGGEFRVNTTTVGQQLFPGVGSDGNGRFLVVWSSFSGTTGSFDLFAQRFMNVSAPLVAMDAPFVYVPYVLNNNVYQPQFRVSWPVQVGLAIDHYEVYVDGNASPAVSTKTNVWLMTAANGLTANSTHTLQVAYVVADGRRSPLSPAATASTWTGITYANALPIEWMAQYYGYGTVWPSVNTPLTPGGPTLMQVFLTGGNPLDPSTWLRTSLQATAQGYFLTWNPQPGLTYQVQTSSSLTSWSNVGPPRLAAGNFDSVFVGGTNTGYYRVLRVR